MSIHITPIELKTPEEERKSFGTYFAVLMANHNNLSYWFPRIKDCGIKVPETVIIPFPCSLLWDVYDEKAKMDDVGEKFFDFVKTIVMPQISHLGNFVFLKNGTFSNKFDATTCIVERNALSIARGLLEIMVMSTMATVDGEAEVVVRRIIPWNKGETPCIYEGLPLRPEIRVFYDFDKREVIGSVNYWDYEKCHDGMFSATDKLVYESRHFFLQQAFEANKSNVESLVAKSMKDVDMQEKWSIDLLLEGGDVWLIDMARAEQSAYFERFMTR